MSDRTLPTGVYPEWKKIKVCKPHRLPFGQDNCTASEWIPARDENGDKIPTGRYAVRVPYTDPSTGKRRNISAPMQTSVKAAAKAAERLRVQRDSGETDRLPSKITFADASSEWLEHRRNRGRASDSTLRSYEKNLAKACDVFGRKPVQKITVADVEKLMKREADKGLTITTTRGVLRDVRSVLDRCVLLETTHRNVAKLVEARGAEKTVRATLPDEAHRLLMDHITGHRNEAAWSLSIDAGLRRGEVMGLRWSDIDLDAGTVNIERSRKPAPRKRTSRRDPRTVVGPPKSRKSKRVIMVWPTLLARIERTKRLRKSEHLRLGVPWSEDAFIAVNEDDVRSPLDPMLPDRYSRLWGLMLDAVGAARVPLHSARHGSVTRMRDKGIPAHQVAAFHGHDEAMTTAIYSHGDDFTGLLKVMSG
jgi:integrase